MAFPHEPFKYFDPKQQMRFVFYLEESGMWIPTYMIQTTGRPEINQNPVTVDYINTEFKVKGKSRWQPIDMTFYDPIQDNGAGLLHQWLETMHHNSRTGVDQYMAGYKRNARLKAFGAPGDPVDSWYLIGCFIGSAGWGNYDLKSDDLVMLNITLSYDYAYMDDFSPKGIPVPGLG